MLACAWCKDAFACDVELIGDDPIRCPRCKALGVDFEKVHTSKISGVRYHVSAIGPRVRFMVNGITDYQCNRSDVPNIGAHILPRDTVAWTLDQLSGGDWR